MLAKENRLKKKKDFERVFKNSKSFKEGFLILKISDSGAKKSRFGFVISQKISKKAVVRNKIKRRLREIIRLKIKNNQLPAKKDMVLISLPGIEKINLFETEKITEKLFKKAGITQ